jgi:hypothetical protein
MRRGFPSISEREAMDTIAATIMTRVKGMAARCGTRRIALPLVGGLLVLSLAACSSSSNGSSTPVASSLTTPQTQPAQGAVKPIAFAPVIGAPAKISSKMNERLVAAANSRNIPVASSGEAEYTVRGYLVASPDPKGAKLSYIWDVTDKNGKRTKRFQGDEIVAGQKGGDPWAAIDDAAIDRIATTTTSSLSEWMTGGAAADGGASDGSGAAVSSTQQAEPIRTADAASPNPSSGVFAAQAAPAPSAPKVEVSAVVLPVTGAPGDGQASLTSAMRRHLENAGVKLTDAASATTYSVKGSVQLDAASGGQQPITIRWTVVDPAGKTMEKAVVQRNKVPEGSLNGQWGQVADLAASEAAKSVARLIRPTS